MSKEKAQIINMSICVFHPFTCVRRGRRSDRGVEAAPCRRPSQRGGQGSGPRLRCRTGGVDGRVFPATPLGRDCVRGAFREESRAPLGGGSGGRPPGGPGGTCRVFTGTGTGLRQDLGRDVRHGETGSHLLRRRRRGRSLPRPLYSEGEPSRLTEGRGMGSRRVLNSVGAVAQVGLFRSSVGCSGGERCLFRDRRECPGCPEGCVSLGGPRPTFETRGLRSRRPEGEGALPGRSPSWKSVTPHPFPL